ncbi:kinase-like domain-containing protein [Sporodiniella umbellata]|nr:kinase-like domain-containing protein [Sporodiniella umbellata]
MKIRVPYLKPERKGTLEEIGPRLDLGQRWPPVKKAGFVRFRRAQGRVKKQQVSKKRPKSDLTPTLVYQLTVGIKETFRQFNPHLVLDKVPQRVLTRPGKGCRNEGYDNEHFDYILKVNEILGHDPDYQYRVIDLLGQGTFGQVVKCERVSTGELFSVKLNQQWDPEDKHHILRLKHVFSHQHHLCLVFELLSYNLYDLMSHNRFHGFPTEKVRAFAVQLLDALTLLKEAKMIHCDLKPENILLTSEKSMTIKVIDFGSSCHEANRVYSYIQSRFYRSPEVLLGLRYTSAIDMWSFGCVVAELFLGLPLFAGMSEYNQIFRIVDMLGDPPKDMLSLGRKTTVFFNKKEDGYTLKSKEQYSQETRKSEMIGKKLFPHRHLREIILGHHGGRKMMSREEGERRKRFPVDATVEALEIAEEQKRRECILDFLRGVLEMNPLRRWTPQQARQHPFISQGEYVGPFEPDGRVEGTRGMRKRSESMNRPDAPPQIKTVAQQLENPQDMNRAYRQRHARSQGETIGLVAPESKDRKVKIAAHVKVRTGSHDTLRASGTRLTDPGKSNSINVKRAHAGEAAGGLLMLRQEENRPKKNLFFSLKQ